MTDHPVLRLRGAAAGFGNRTLWSGLDLDVARGEFLAVLGANGTGKTTLLRSVLGLQGLRAGTLEIDGRPPRRGSSAVGYVPQERTLDPRAPIVAREFVALGLDGNRWGFGWPSARRRRAVAAALARARAHALAHPPLGNHTRGEGPRVRIAQAVATDPSLLLCDEPLVSLDLRGQAEVAALIDRRRTEHGTAVVFVTHEINPVLPYVDRVLYLAGGRFKLGTVDEVMTSASLTALYDSPVEVIRSSGRILVAGMPDHHATHHDHDSHRAHDASFEEV